MTTTSRLSITALAPVALAFATGCGGGAGQQAVDLAGALLDAAVAGGAVPDLAVAPEDLTPAYPAGPYGSDVGDVVADLAWEGFVDEDGAIDPATGAPYRGYTMQDLHRSGRRYALIHLAATY
jgi:hypothetical protein